MSQPDDALDRAFSRLCMAVIKSAKQDLMHQGRYERRSAKEFFWGRDSYFPMFLEFLLIEYPGVRMDCLRSDDKGEWHCG